MFYPIVDLSHI